MDAKLLTESGLKAILSKHKIKDNGLQKALAAYDKLQDDAHDECLDQLAQIGKLATALKKAKEAAANKAVVDYLEDLLDARDHEEKDVSKDKEAAAKTDAAKDKAKKGEKDEDKGDKDKDEDEDEDGEDEKEEGEYGERLLTAFNKCKSMGGEPLAFIICDARPYPAVMLAKRISSKHRKELTEMAAGSKKFHRGTCRFADGKYVLTTDQPMPGLVRRVQQSVKNYTGKKFKFVHGDETAGDEEGETPETGQGETEPASPQADPNAGSASQPQGSTASAAGPPKPGDKPQENVKKPFTIGGAVGRGGKNAKEDVEAVQTALNSLAHAGLKVDGICGPKTIAAIMAFQKTLGQLNPDGNVTPGRGTARGLAGQVKPGPPAKPPAPVAPPALPKAELKKAPEVWHKTRDILKTNIGELKKAVQGHYATEHPELVKQIAQGLGKLDGILETLDTGLADSLGKAGAAGEDAARKTELQNSKKILTEYIKYVKGEPLIAHIDKNPFGVDTNIKKVLTDALTHMAQAMA
jgi:peptidoglycan hydrolase-like protein with peptidoglycan-binding domain